MGKPATTIDGYLAAVSPERRALLQALRRELRALLPEAEECLSYGIPAFRVEGGIVGGFAATSKGGSYYPFSGSTLTTLSDALTGHTRTLSALHFTAEKPLSRPLLRKLVQTRLAEMKPAKRDPKKAKATSRPRRKARSAKQP